MKRVGVVTWLGSGNYGTSLQSYALCKYLELEGQEVTIFSHSASSINKYKSSIKKFLNYIGIWNLYQYYKNKPKSLKEAKLFDFNKSQYNKAFIFDEEDLKNYVSEIDIFITGSDQIWNTYYSYSPFFFLDFVNGKRKIAYASSFGAPTIKEEYKENVKSLLSEFTSIGVREDSAVNLVNQLLPDHNNVVQVLDPTFLLNSKQWIEFGKKSTVEINISGDYIFCYMIGNRESYKQQLESVRRLSKIDQIIVIPSSENPEFNIDGAIVYKDAGPFEFIKLLSESKLICTDSFHATALSINLSKDFVEFIRFDDSDIASQNSRIYDLLNHYGLMSRIYQKDNLGLDPIEYDNVQQILKEDRQKSINFLKEALK